MESEAEDRHGVVRKTGEHTWVLSPVDPATAVTNTIRVLRQAGATKEADRLQRRAQALMRPTRG